MAEPIIAQKKPYVLEEEAGQKKAWCACGRSSNQPFCDGTHAKENTGITPIVCTVEKSGKTAWCGCKQSGNKPFCDGTHNRL